MVTPKQPPTTDEVLVQLRRDYPGHQFTCNKAGNAVAVKYHPSDPEWQLLASQLIGTNEWVMTSGNLLVNGEPVWKQED